MYNKKFINNLKKKYSHGGIKKYQGGNFLDQEIDAWQKLDQMEQDHYKWANTMTVTEDDGSQITVGPIYSSFMDDDGFVQDQFQDFETLNITHDNFQNYSPLTQEIQTLFAANTEKLPEYLQTLSDDDLFSLMTDQRENDLGGLPLFDMETNTMRGTNPEWNRLLVNESIRRAEETSASLRAGLDDIKTDVDKVTASIKEVQSQDNLTLGDKIDMALSTGGMSPVVGIFADALNLGSNLIQSGHSLVTGDWDELKKDLTNVAWGIPALIPGLGQGTGSAKMSSNVNKIVKATDKGGDVIKATDKTTDLNKHQNILNNRLNEIRNKNLPVPVKKQEIVPFNQGKVNFTRHPNTNYPIVKYSKNSEPIVNNPINKNAGKIPMWKRPFTGWGDAYKQVKDAVNTPMINWRPGNTFVKPLGALTRHFTTPKWMAIDAAIGGATWWLIDEYVLEPAEQQLKEQQDIEEWNAKEIEKRKQQSVIMSPDDFDPNITTGENIFNMMKYQGRLEEIKMDWYQNGYEIPDGQGGVEIIKLSSPDISDEDLLQIMISGAPLLWGEDTDWNVKKFGPGSENVEVKAFGGYKRRQLGGGYMGVPQQGVGDEGNYMGRMQQFQMGGQPLPGGQVSPIPGSDAVEFTGQTHAEGGIMMDPQTEVEDGETMDKVTMAKEGGPKDYFFSSHLKKGGKSFAQHHKDILARGGSQEDIDWLAKMQEKAAGRNPNNVAVAKTGGYKRRYSNGGTPERNIYSPEYDKVEEVYKDLGYTDLSGGTNFRGIDHGDEGYKNIQGENLQDGVHTGYYGDIGPAEREGFWNRNKDILESYVTDKNNDGVVDWKDFDPLTETGVFQQKYNAFLRDEWNNNEDLQTGLKNKGLNSVEDYVNAVGFTDSGHSSQKVDNFFGSFTHGRTSMRNPNTPPEPPGECSCTDANNPEVQHPYPCDGPMPAACNEIPPPPTDQGNPCPCDPKLDAKDPNCCKDDEFGPGPLQLLPAMYAFGEGPDYMREHPMASPAAIMPERLSKTHLERVDMNADRARNASDARALNKFIETSGGGASNIVNKMAAFAKKRQADAEITDSENKTNIAIANQEMLADQDRKKTNVVNALDASKFNVTSQLEANKHNSTMAATVDEFNAAADAAVKDRRLMALDNAAKTIAGLYTDKKAYEAQERMALAVSGQTGIYNREKNKLAYSKQLIENGIMPGTPEYNDAMQKFGIQSAKYGGYRRRFLK